MHLVDSLRKCLPGQGVVSQVAYSVESPKQLFPSSEGRGCVHVLSLLVVPGPQELLHGAHWPQALQPPWTGKSNILVK